jgi:hypothetical protein
MKQQNINMNNEGVLELELNKNIETEFVKMLKDLVGLDIEFMSAERQQKKGVVKYRIVVTDLDKQKTIKQLIITIMKSRLTLNDN